MRTARSLLGVVAVSLVSGACGRDRIVVVHDGPAPQAAGNPPQAIATTTASTEGDGDWGIRDDRETYAEVVRKVAAMPSDSELLRRVAQRRLGVVNVAWEDTGRFQGSAVGPNISDLSLQVRQRVASEGGEGRFQETVMPVIRFPNFSDRTGDVDRDKFFVRVGNQGRGALSTVALTDLLRDVRKYVSVPSSILGSGNLLAPGDSHFLVSAQAVFLPIPKRGKAEFNPVLFNYQSSPGAPAVLSILVTRQGSSVQVIENRQDERSGAGWGQQLYFNDQGQRASFTAERKADVEQRIAAQGGPRDEDDRSALAKGADMLFLVQVPLVGARPRRALPPMPAPSLGAAPGGGAAAESKAKKAESAPSADGMRYERSDVEQAVLGHGPRLGPFEEGRGLRLERDTRFPVRITVQFYKATSNGVVSDDDLDKIATSIGSVYEHADYVGSLVLPEGDARRPTAWQRMPAQWFPW